MTTLGVAGVVLACTFGARGGSQLDRTTWTEVGLLLVGGTVTAVAFLVPSRGRMHGAVAILAFAALCAYAALSITWSLAPSDSWLEANLTFSYLAIFAGAAALAWLVPGQWRAVLFGLAIAAVVVGGWALLTKVFPAALAPNEPFARLRPPFDYWNSVGLACALGVFPLLWLATRRSGHAAVNALAWPGIGLLLVALLLAYSRGALLALGLGLALWIALVPLRLRAVAVLAAAAVTATPVVAFAFAQDGLTRDRAPMMARVDAGAELGALLLLLVACLLAAGLAVGFLTAQHPPRRRSRRIAGRTLLVALAAVPLVALVLLSQGPGGVGGEVSRAWHNAVNPQAKAPNNSPERLTATASVRARYWEEALKIHRASSLLGTGAGSFATVRTRVRQNGNIIVRHAHGYVVQTLADLGWVGLGLSLLAALAWLAAAARTLRLRRGVPWDAERVGLATLAVLVVVFGLHSAIDWTWYIPGNAVPALICAGWVAGRGPRREPVEPPAEPRRVRRAGIVPAAVVAAATVVTAWAVVQPMRSAHAEDAAFNRLSRGEFTAAASIAGIAHQRNPLSVDPLWDLAAIDQARGDNQAALRALEQAVALEPANAETWRRLGDFKLTVLGDPRGALSDFQAAYYLDPKSPQSSSDVILAARAVSAAPAPPASGGAPARRRQRSPAHP